MSVIPASYARRAALVVALVAVVAGFVGLSVAPAAVAATPSPTPSTSATAPAGRPASDFVEYTGTLHVTSSYNGTPNPPRDVPLTIGVDCTKTPCVLYNVEANAVTVPFTTKKGGHAELAESGDPCTPATHREAATIDFTATRTTLTVHYVSPEQGQVECPTGSIYYDASVSDFVGTVSAGTPCVIDRSCSSATPRPNSDATRTVTYSGTLRSPDPNTDNSATLTYSSKPMTIVVFCRSSARCTVTLLGDTIHLVGGRASTHSPSNGKCGVEGRNAETISADATAMRLSITKRYSAETLAGCSFIASTFTFTGTLSKGSPCLIDGTCDSGPRTAATRSILSTLPTTATALTPRNSLWALVGALVLIILIALPTRLLDSASETISEQIDAWRTRRRHGNAVPGAAPTETPRPPVAWSGWPFAALGVLAASIVSAFVDPAFGFDAASLRTVLSVLTSFVLEVIVGWFVVLVIVRRAQPQATATFEFKPLSLLIVAIAVLLTRVTGFQPGIVFGLVAGIVFGGLIGSAKARVALIGLAYSFGVGVLAWVGYSILETTAGTGPSAGVVFVQEALASAAIAGIAAVPITLLPVGSLVGRQVWKWNKIVWGTAYAIGLIGFFLVLMPMPFAWARVPLGLWTWIGLYLAYAVVAVVVWLIVNRGGRSTTPAESTVERRDVEPSSGPGRG